MRMPVLKRGMWVTVKGIQLYVEVENLERNLCRHCLYVTGPDGRKRSVSVQGNNIQVWGTAARVPWAHEIASERAVLRDPDIMDTTSTEPNIATIAMPPEIMAEMLGR